jgi:hypothetical protein
MSLLHVEFEQPVTHYDKSSAALRRNFGKETKDILARFYNVVGKLTLLCGSSVGLWVKQKADMLRQHRLKFLGPLAGVTRRENFRNENI